MGLIIVAAIVKILLIVGFLFNMGALLTWVDRRLSAMMQDRVGPNRAVLKLGKFELRVAGLLHTAADGVKFFFKEDFMPPKADKLLFSLAPMLAMIPVLALVAVIPFGDTLCVGTDLWHRGCAPIMGADGEILERLRLVGDQCIRASGEVASITPSTIFPAVSRMGVCTLDAKGGVCGHGGRSDLGRDNRRRRVAA